MRRLNNLVTFFTAITAFFFGSFITKILSSVDQCPAHRSRIPHLEPHPKLFLMVLVLSAPHNSDERNAMRSTWLANAGQSLTQPYLPEELIYLPTFNAQGHLQVELVAEQASRLRQYTNWQQSLLTEDPPKTKRLITVKHVFSIGTLDLSSSALAELEKEQKQHNDLLLRHNEFSYVLKVDDDTYVKLDSLVNTLVSYDRKLLRKRSEYRDHVLPQLYWGYFNGRSTIKTKGQWKESSYYLSKNYLPYALGGGYVLSRSLCDYIVNNSQLLSPYGSEDVSVGTWLAPLRHVYRWHDPRFDTSYAPRKCRSYHMVLHKRSGQMMRDIHDGELCSGIGSSILSDYYYDWTRTADKCCDSLVA
ncbi:beta-1,3-galactosyltransferase 6 [Drosophila sechellia]|uniref:Hexosyltransferase n=1 Tax=Drosophila sechellia TaxID=7238 RepID=B4HS02_DROSE|nr:beta-1,3-galactosyltransferase 6 [Drosophila sechellia]